MLIPWYVETFAEQFSRNTLKGYIFEVDLCNTCVGNTYINIRWRSRWKQQYTRLPPGEEVNQSMYQSFGLFSQFVTLYTLLIVFHLIGYALFNLLNDLPLTMLAATPTGRSTASLCGRRSGGGGGGRAADPSAFLLSRRPALAAVAPSLLTERPVKWSYGRRNTYSSEWFLNTRVWTTTQRLDSDVLWSGEQLCSY